MGEIKLQVMALISETRARDVRKYGLLYFIGEGEPMKKLVALEDAEAVIREKDAEIGRLKEALEEERLSWIAAECKLGANE